MAGSHSPLRIPGEYLVYDSRQHIFTSKQTYTEGTAVYHSIVPAILDLFLINYDSC